MTAVTTRATWWRFQDVSAERTASRKGRGFKPRTNLVGRQLIAMAAVSSVGRDVPNHTPRRPMETLHSAVIVPVRRKAELVTLAPRMPV